MNAKNETQAALEESKASATSRRQHQRRNNISLCLPMLLSFCFELIRAAFHILCFVRLQTTNAIRSFVVCAQAHTLHDLDLFHQTAARHSFSTSSRLAGPDPSLACLLWIIGVDGLCAIRKCTRNWYREWRFLAPAEHTQNHHRQRALCGLKSNSFHAAFASFGCARTSNTFGFLSHFVDSPARVDCIYIIIYKQLQVSPLQPVRAPRIWKWFWFWIKHFKLYIFREVPSDSWKMEVKRWNAFSAQGILRLLSAAPSFSLFLDMVERIRFLSFPLSVLLRCPTRWLFHHSFDFVWETNEKRVSRMR